LEAIRVKKSTQKPEDQLIDPRCALYEKRSWERGKKEHTTWKNTNTFRLTLTLATSFDLE